MAPRLHYTQARATTKIPTSASAETTEVVELWAARIGEHHDVPKFILSLSALVLSMGACAAEKKPAASPIPANCPTISKRANPKPDNDATRGGLNISDEIRKACG